MKKKIIIIIMILNMLFLDVALAAQTKEPIVAADSSILMDYKTGRVLWGKNIYKPRSMASTTKIMTCILALENSKIDDIVVVSQRAALAPKVKIYLRKGEKQRLEDLLYALMLVSANDAAVAIAEHVSGSVENFCMQMTEKAKEIGAKDTVFKTPNGLDKEDHHSTAYDMALITRYALGNKKFKDIISTRNVYTPVSRGKYRSFSLTNHNKLLTDYPGGNGVKTGFTNAAGQCFVGSAENNGMQLISVVLASGWGNAGKQAKWTDTKKVLNYGFDNFKYEVIYNKDDILAKNVEVKKSKKQSIELYLRNDIILPIKDSEKEKLRVEIYYPEQIEAPIEKGVEIGVARIYIDEDYICEGALLANKYVEENTMSSNFDKIISEYSWVVN
ncbi:MAG TPA: D-alanyl-D-alanine carboxypeptidase [Clostridiales bacterium]|nr:D-alanyl-D-alanine carboxypeptidase [Clostridiales bacterium]